MTPIHLALMKHCS